MAFTKVKITGTFHDPSGKAINGNLEVLLSRTMQNGTEQANPKPLRIQIRNGVLAPFELYATDDPATEPGSPLQVYYLFRVRIGGGTVVEEFKSPVSNEHETLDITKLREVSGEVGFPGSTIPTLNVYSSNQAIVEALAYLKLVHVEGIVGSGAAGPQLTGPPGPPGPAGAPGRSVPTYHGFVPTPHPIAFRLPVNFVLEEESIISLNGFVDVNGPTDTVSVKLFINGVEEAHEITHKEKIRVVIESGQIFGPAAGQSLYETTNCGGIWNMVLPAGSHTVEWSCAFESKEGETKTATIAKSILTIQVLG